MSDLLQALNEAAARGVEVTIITNDHDPLPTRLKWQHEHFWWGARSKTRACGFEVVVTDLDGDTSEWVVRRGGKEIASGGGHDCSEGYHFDLAMMQAEAALFAEVGRRRVVLKTYR